MFSSQIVEHAPHQQGLGPLGMFQLAKVRLLEPVKLQERQVPEGLIAESKTDTGKGPIPGPIDEAKGLASADTSVVSPVGGGVWACQA